MASRHSEYEVENQALCTLVQAWVPQYAKILKAIDPDYLQAEPYRWFIKQFQEYHQRYNTSIPWEYADLLIRREFQDEEQQAEMRKVIWLLYSTPITWGEAAIQDFREYVSWRTYSAGVSAAQEGFRKSRSMELALEHAQTAINDAAVLLHDVEIHDLADDFESRAAEWQHNAQNPNLRNRLMIGIPDLDKQLKWTEGTVNSFLAPLKRYKSFCLSHCGLAALAQGYNVLHVTFENSIEDTEDRYFSRLSHIPITVLTEMKEDPAKFKQAREFINALKSGLMNRLKIIRGVPKETSVADIETILEVAKYEQGFIPDVSVFDYCNLIKPGKEFKGARDLEQEDVIWNLKRHAEDVRGHGTHRKIVLTAAQANRGGIKKESLDEGDVGQSIGIPQAVDSLLTINQNKQEEIDDIIRFEVKVSRNCARGDPVSVKSDISWACIDVDHYQCISDKLGQLLLRSVA